MAYNGYGKRVWPSAYKYKDMYGEDVPYDTPDLRADKTLCKWCGQPLKNKRQYSFCSNECSINYGNMLVWQRTIPKVPWCIIIRDNYTCQECGITGIIINEHGQPIPCNRGLEVHHIIPVSEGGSDHISNLITLCEECHKKQHRKAING